MTTALPILYGNRESGHAFKVRFALRLLDIEHDYRDVDVFLPRNERRPDWQAASRFGEVPVYVVDGNAITQSNAILLHLARSRNALGWEVDPDMLQQWLFWEANRIAMSLPHIRFHAHFPVPIAPDVLAWMHERLQDDLAVLDEALASAEFLMGNSISAADISCSGYMFFADQVPIDLSPWPNVVRWLERIKSQPQWSHPYAMMV
jgi:glutathione S-transferase